MVLHFFCLVSCVADVIGFYHSAIILFAGSILELNECVSHTYRRTTAKLN